MFSLIITIVSIALVVALVAATMYHGGDTLTTGRTTADAAAFVTGAQQVGGAAVMFQSLESAPATNVQTDLVAKNYLASTPVVKGSTLALGKNIALKNVVTSNVATAAVCAQINKTAGVVAVADQKAATETTFANLPYGCVNAAAGAEGGVFQFKY